MKKKLLKIINTFIPALVLVLAGCQPKAPEIYTIEPQIGNMGEPVIISGAFFGAERNESYVTIAGAQPTSMSYLNWSDNEITFRIPEFGEAGLVYVHINGRKSNGVLFANQATLPAQIQNTEAGLGPVISSLTPQSGVIGTLLSISGTGFGNTRGDGGVFFTWNGELPASAPAEERQELFIEASGPETGYELWSDREIRMHIPDGAASGNIEVRTAKGNSPPRQLDLSGRPGNKTFRDKRSYTLTYSVNVKIGQAETPNTLYLWIPRPVESAAQRNIELLSCNIDPFIDRYRGTSLFKLDNLAAESETRINLSWKVDIFSVETAVAFQSIKQDAGIQPDSTYLQSSAQLPADDPRIKELVSSIMGRERNPYIRAQRIYEWMLAANFDWVKQAEGDLFDMIATKQADPYLAALLYCTLLRAAGIPCQPVAGVLVSRNRETMPHYWAEFWVNGFGWVPVDPAMGAEAFTEQYNTLTNRASFYFGSIDSRRIVFSRGLVNLLPMDPRGRTVTHNRSYSMQNLWEEVVGGIESYSSLWGGITITGMYAQ